MSDAPFTPEQIGGIVREVLRRIGAGRLPPTASPAPPPAAYAIDERIVTGAIVAAIPAGTRSVTLRPDALITPSARDAARSAGVLLVRGTKRSGATSAAGVRPVFVAAAECPGESAGRTASLVRALPGAQQLPSSGLADVVASLALHLTRDGGRGILLAGRPHVAAALANRSAGVRAVTTRDAASLLAAVRECAANLLVVGPRDFSGPSLERIGVAFVGGEPAPLPAELAPPRASGCPCGGPKPDACTCATHSHSSRKGVERCASDTRSAR